MHYIFNYSSIFGIFKDRNVCKSMQKAFHCLKLILIHSIVRIFENIINYYPFCEMIITFFFVEWYFSFKFAFGGRRVRHLNLLMRFPISSVHKNL